MVNYSRMETVWRSYGPLEPIGPSASGGRRRPTKSALAGLAAVCVVGAAAGLYLRPTLEAEGASRPAVAERNAGAPDAPQPERVASTGEAARLQSQLQLLVLGGVAPSATAADAPQPLPQRPMEPAFGAPATPPAFAAPPAPPMRAAAPVRAAPQTPARRPAERPVVLASRTPAPVSLSRTPARQIPPAPPRAAAPARVAPAPAPEPVAPTPAISVPAEAERRSEGPSYECGRARSTAERMICASSDLAALDRNMTAELEAAIAAGHSPRELARDQANWRKRRDQAAPDPRAVADIYRQRIGQLRSMQ